MDVVEQLNLSAAQRSKITAMRDESDRKLIRIEADARIAELDLRRLVESDAPDPSEVDAPIDRIGDLRTQMRKLHVKTWLIVRSTLTAEQRTKLRSLAGSGPRDRDDDSDAPRKPPGRSRRP